LLPDGHLDMFRREAFAPSQPALLPREHFLKLPAIKKWFVQSQQNAGETELNYNYFGTFRSAIVPLELSQSASPASAERSNNSFPRAEVPFQIFLEWISIETAEALQRLYLAQASLTSLLNTLSEDPPVPEIIAKAGSGDIYDTNLEIGIPPTYTPLHRDSNLNTFVQLSGHKLMRMLRPELGNEIFGLVRRVMGKSRSAMFRGEKMMEGEEKRLL